MMRTFSAAQHISKKLAYLVYCSDSFFSFKCRYILDNPCVVKGRSVLDLGSGCGATAIAAVMSGASQVLANDIDPSKPFFSYLCTKIFIIFTVYLKLFPHSLGRICFQTEF